MRSLRRVITPAIALLIVTGVASADDPYADFRIPEHRTFAWLVTGSVNASSRYGGSIGGVNRDGTLSSRLSAPLQWHAESEARQWDVRLDPQASWSSGRSRLEFSPGTFAQREIKRRANDQSMSVSLSRSDYPGSGRVFVSSAVFSTVFFSQRVDGIDDQFSSPPFRSLNGFRFESGTYQQSGSASIGVGLGRVRNATGVYGAQLLEARLRATGRLRRALSDETRRRLAELYYIAGDFKVAHERSGKYFWREAERILREDGALDGGSLDAYSLLRVLEPVTGTLFWSRQSGALVGASLVVREQRGHDDLLSRTTAAIYQDGVLQNSFESSTSVRRPLDQDIVSVGISAAYHRPIGLRWQADWNTFASYGGGRSRSFTLIHSAQASWLVADRWYATGFFRHRAESARVDGVRYPPSWGSLATATVGYWVEDSWSLDLALSQQQAASQVDPKFGGVSSYVRDARLDIGLTYRPAGRLSAPGLGIEQRLTTPPL